jgi:LmbE family N-acetylglucosaminyl deacetylase
LQRLSLNDGEPLDVVVIGAHADDIEIGCGGTLLRWAGEGRLARVTWCVFSGDEERANEARAGAAAIVPPEVECQVQLHRFRDGWFPQDGGAVKGVFEELKGEVSPDLVLAPRRDDLHQDHRLLGEITWQTFRNHLIWEYEIPKYEGDLVPPNLFVCLPPDVAGKKIDILTRTFASQWERSWFHAETFESLMRLRGIEAAAPSGYAEAFHARKLVL